MQPVQTPITGREDLGDLRSPLRALAQFYAAFNRRDLHAMRRNWLPYLAERFPTEVRAAASAFCYHR
jgi:hypothetical protein